MIIDNYILVQKKTIEMILYYKVLTIFCKNLLISTRNKFYERIILTYVVVLSARLLMFFKLVIYNVLCRALSKNRGLLIQASFDA